MQGVQFLFYFLHEGEVVVIELGLPSLQIAIVCELSEINVCPGKAFGVGEVFIEVLGLVQEVEFLCELGYFLFELVFLLDQLS